MHPSILPEQGKPSEAEINAALKEVDPPCSWKWRRHCGESEPGDHQSWMALLEGVAALSIVMRKWCGNKALLARLSAVERNAKPSLQLLATVACLHAEMPGLPQSVANQKQGYTGRVVVQFVQLDPPSMAGKPYRVCGTLEDVHDFTADAWHEWLLASVLGDAKAADEDKEAKLWAARSGNFVAGSSLLPLCCADLRQHAMLARSGLQQALPARDAQWKQGPPPLPPLCPVGGRGTMCMLIAQYTRRRGQQQV